MRLLEMSFSGAVFILAVVMIRTITINYLPKKTFLVLWEMVLLRLIVPFAIPSVFSVYSLMNRSISVPLFSRAKTDGIGSVLSQKYFFIEQGVEQLPANSPSVLQLF